MSPQVALQALAALLVATVVLIGMLAVRPGLMSARGGRLLALMAFCILPGACLWAGLAVHLESSKSTEFCLSCHVMEPYGKSLLLDDEFAIPAVHYQDRLVDRDHSCFTCHTQYTMFGDYKAKVAGLKHLYIYYFDEVPESIELYEPYHNRECLHCHAGARSFEETHEDDLAELLANEMTCLDCHDTGHEVDTLAEADFWPRKAAP